MKLHDFDYRNYYPHLEFEEDDAAPVPKPRECDIDGCGEEGAHRAPQSRTNIDHYYWFCLDHVREYNTRWNYYAGMSDMEVEADRRKDITWERPTWPLTGLNPRVDFLKKKRIQDPFGFFGKYNSKEEEAEDAVTEVDGKSFLPLTREGKALRVLEITGNLTFDDVKSAYKVLVKKHHPDANRGHKKSTEKIKEINEAYDTLRKALKPRK